MAPKRDADADVLAVTGMDTLELVSLSRAKTRSQHLTCSFR